MNDLEPIELEILMNSTELRAEFEKVMGTVKDYDTSVATAKKGFSAFVADQLKSISALDENAKLTEKQAAALQRHSQTLDDLKGKISETFDPTQLGVYQYQLAQTEQAITQIIETANKNVALMNTAEIEAANQKLEDALQLLDKISDSTFTPSFASPEELDILSTEINKTDDALQQLGAVIDFVSAKMGGMDPASEEFKQLQADISAANDMLGRTPQLYDATGNSINQMSDALKTFQEQLAGETDPEAIKTLNANIETLENGIQQVKNAGKTGFDEFGNKIEEQKEKTVSLQTELENLVGQMAKLRMANQEGSSEYEILKNKAVETRSAIALTNNEITTGVKNTANLQGLINITQNIAAGYGLVSGAVGLFNSNQEQSQKIIQRVTSVVAVLQSLQQIQVALNVKDAATTAVVTNAKNFLSAASLRLAAALGISQVAAQALMATLTLGLSVVITAVIIAFDRLSEKQEQQQTLNKKVAESAAEPIMAYRKMQDRWNALGNDLEAKKRFITENVSEFNNLGIAVNDVSDAERVFGKGTAAMVSALRERAKAAAAMQLATEQYKLALQAQMDYERQLEVRKTGTFFEKAVNDPERAKREWKAAEDAANKYFNTYQKASAAAPKVLQNAGIKTNSAPAVKYEDTAEGKAEAHKLRLAKERYGKADKLELDYLNKKLRYSQRDKEEYEKTLQEIELLQARSLRNRENATVKSTNNEERAAAAAARKKQQIMAELANKQSNVRAKVDTAVENIDNKETEGDELAAIKKKWEELRKEAKKYGLEKDSALKMKIDLGEAKEVGLKTYELETKAKLQELNRQKELYAAYESFKTNIAQTEFAKRNGINLEEFGTYSDIIDAEIRKLTEKAQLTALEAERLKALQAIKTEADTDKGNKDTQDLDKAIQDTITYQETVAAIEKDFAERRKLIEANTSGEIRTQKLAMLEQQKSDALNAANQEAIEKTEIFRQLNDRMLQETEQELKARIAALKKMLQDPSLNPEHKAKIEKGLSDAEKLKGNSEEQTRINQLIERRRLLEEAAGLMVDKTSQAYLDAKQSVELLNKEIERSQKAKPFAQTAQWASMISSSFGDLANSIGDSNEGLADTIGTIGEVAGAVADVAGGIAESIMSGNPIAAIGGIIKGISKIFAIGKAARESEKKAQEELKKRQEEQLQAQLDYNATLRQRMIDETKINDLYKSRVDNIKEEMEARSKAMVKNLKDQQMLFNRMLNMTTTVGQYTEKYGGFLGIGRKTRVVDIQKTIGSLLGIAGSKSPFVSIFDKSPFLKRLMSGNNPFNNLISPDTVTITDEMFEKLELLNSQQPLTGDAKNAYEQLKKLRDEYGSFEEANRQLEIQLKNAITGTTAQSLADSIREGLKSGKKSFADFANDIEGFLREAILAGISAKMIEPKIQELQDALADMMGDGILSAEERAQFQEMYMAIVSQSQEYMDIVNQAGVNLTTGSSSVNSLQGAIKGASQESIDILSGHTAAMKLTQFETNTILKNGFAQQLEQTSRIIAVQLDIERNTRRTADNTEKLHDVNDNVVKVADGQDKYYRALQAAGIIK